MCNGYIIPPPVPVAGDYNVLNTDYETYTAVYSCVGLFGLGHVEQVRHGFYLF